MPDPISAEEWLALVRQHEISARLLCEDKIAASQGYAHAGTAVEFALKARIMKRERLNGWPSVAARPDLHTHDLRALLNIAGIVLTPTSPARRIVVHCFAMEEAPGL